MLDNRLQKLDWTGFEPATTVFALPCSTVELPAHISQYCEIGLDMQTCMPILKVALPSSSELGHGISASTAVEGVAELTRRGRRDSPRLVLSIPQQILGRSNNCERVMGHTLQSKPAPESKVMEIQDMSSSRAARLNRLESGFRHQQHKSDGKCQYFNHSEQLANPLLGVCCRGPIATDTQSTAGRVLNHPWRKRKFVNEKAARPCIALAPYNIVKHDPQNQGAQGDQEPLQGPVLRSWHESTHKDSIA